MTTSLLIQPLDVLLFRDGKPFSAGDDHLARSIFPPLPSTLTGFVRSKLFHSSGGDWDKVKAQFGDIGGPTDYGDFRMCGLFLRKDGKDYVPAPSDILQEKENENLVQANPRRFDARKLIQGNYPDSNLAPLWADNSQALTETNGFIPIDSLMEDYLCNTVPKKVLGESEFVKREPRTSIEMNHGARSAKEGQLFSVDFLRPLDGVSFHVVFDGIRWPDESGLDTLGGESRPVCWNKNDDWQTPDSTAIREKLGKNGLFKIVLLTPAVFENGWRPGHRLEDILEKAGIRASLVAAAVRRPVSIGGFDLANKRPKPMRPGAPAGSVYFFVTESGDASALVDHLMFKCISDLDWEAGFGLAAIGSWSYIND